MAVLLLAALAFLACADGQGYLVIPQSRPHEPDVLSVCACDFGDNFWLHLLSGLSEHAPRGFKAHATDQGFHKWLSEVQCHPWPLDDVDQLVARAAGAIHWEDSRYGRRYHYLDPWIREEHYINPRIGLATRAACLPGRLLLRLICAHQALLPAVHGQHPRWGAFAEMLQDARELLPMAVGREKECDLGSLEDSDEERGCAALWPWAPAFDGRKLNRLKAYLDRVLSGSLALPEGPVSAAYDQPFALTEAQRARVNPYLQPCVPLVRDCWAWGLRTELPEQERCEHCCDPALPRGDPACFDAVYTFERCCRKLSGR